MVVVPGGVTPRLNLTIALCQLLSIAPSVDGVGDRTAVSVRMRLSDL